MLLNLAKHHDNPDKQSDSSIIWLRIRRVNLILHVSKTHFPRVLRANGDSKLCSDERVVYQVSHIQESFPIVITGKTQWQVRL